MAGLDWVSPKTIRKTVATAIYSADGLDNASQQLGHSEVGVTAKHYVQRLNIGPAGVVGVLDEWLAKRIVTALSGAFGHEKIPSPKPLSLVGGDMPSRLRESNSRPIHYENLRT